MLKWLHICDWQHIVSGVSFITAHVVYASTNKIKIVSTEMKLIFYRRVDVPRTLTLHCFHSLISIQTFGRALTASVDSCIEIKSAPSFGKSGR